MTIEELIDRLPLITAVAFGVGALLVLVAMQFFRRSRRAPYWTQRRQAGQRGFRILLGSTFFFTISAFLCALTLVNNYIEGDEATTVVQNLSETPTEITPTVADTNTVEPSATFTEAPTITNTPTFTLETSATDEPSVLSATDLPQPSETPTDTSPTATDVPPTDVPPTATNTSTLSPTSTATLEPTLTRTPTDTLQPTSAVVIATVIGSRVPAADASISIVSLSNRISNELRPTNQGNEFDAGFSRLYFMLDYENLSNGVRWRRELYHNGNLINGREDLWGNQGSGQSLFFTSLPGGFEAGDYTLQILIGSEVADEMDFTVN